MGPGLGDDQTYTTHLDSADDYHPTWTPEGRRLAFTSTRDGAANLYWQLVDGTEEAERLTRNPHLQMAASWHPSGKFLAIQQDRPRGGNDVMVLSLGSDATVRGESGPTTAVLAAGPFNGAEPSFSPDGRWVAYQSNETGRAEVFVRSFSGSAGKWRVSTDGGRDVVWSRTKPELVVLGYHAESNHGGALYRGGPLISVRAPAALVERSHWAGRDCRGRKFDLHPDGEHVVIVPAERQKSDHITIIFNFFDALQRLAPVSQ